MICRTGIITITITTATIIIMVCALSFAGKRLRLNKEAA
jgi:hypothetical protein